MNAPFNAAAVDHSGKALATSISRRVTDRSARGIAGAVGRMITAAELSVGSRLPTGSSAAEIMRPTAAAMPRALRSVTRPEIVEASALPE